MLLPESRDKCLMPCRVVPLFAALLTFITLIWRLDGRLGTPPEDVDGVYYDALALGVSDGMGFHPRLDEKFLAPYAGPNERVIKGLIAGYINFGIDQTSSYRPPLFPTTLALIYKLSGRNFLVLHLVQVFFLAAIIFTLSAIFCTHRQFLSVFFLSLLFSSEVLIPATVVGPLTEPLAMFFIALAWRESILMLERDRKWFHAALLGVFLGASALIRLATSPLIFLVPMTLYFAARFLMREKSIFPQMMLASFVGVITLTPWAIRNCIIHQSFMPLGSQAGIALGLHYQYSIKDSGGYWSFHSDWNIGSDIPTEIRGSTREAMNAKEGQKRAYQWILENYKSVPQITWERLREYWWPLRRPDQKLYVIICLLGLLLALKNGFHSQCIAALSFFVAQTFSLVLSTNDQLGRYLMICYPLIFFFAAYGLAEVMREVIKLYDRAFSLRLKS